MAPTGLARACRNPWAEALEDLDTTSARQIANAVPGNTAQHLCRSILEEAA